MKPHFTNTINPIDFPKSKYTAPPRRKWVGLTDEELVDMVGRATDNAGGWFRYHFFARAIEAALKERNA